MVFLKILLASFIIMNSLQNSSQFLVGDFYRESCPLLEEIVRYIIKNKVLRQPRVAAQLLRLHFHDCFVQGCDGSVLLDSNGAIVSEKGANPNRNSLRGFEVIDEIKAALEEACPLTVSCADIVAIAARDSVVLEATQLGWQDAYKENIYEGFSNFQKSLSSICPRSGNDNKLAPLDYSTPAYFDNHYYQNLVESKGLLHSDNVLVLEDQDGEIQQRVWGYATNRQFFFESFVDSMIKMGNINVLTGNKGEVRKNCRFVN
ncbi:Peroxidase 14 [Bienertia sinuspersici]